MNENKNNNVEHPQHYGGADNPYEAIKVIEAWNLGFHLGNTLKYISRAGKKDSTKTVEDLEKALWYAKRFAQFAKESSPIEVDFAYSNPSLVLDAWNIKTESTYDFGHNLRIAVFMIYEFSVLGRPYHFDEIHICLGHAILELKSKIKNHEQRKID